MLALTEEQQRTLHILGYLYLRMGHYERAKTLFAALEALDSSDLQTQRSLAVINLELGDGEASLEHINRAIKEPLSTRDAILYLVKAKALHLLGRENEAKVATEAWLAIGGQKA